MGSLTRKILMSQKSSVSHMVLMCSERNLRNKNRKDLAKNTGVVPAKYPSNVNLENFYNSRMPEFG